MKLTRVQLSVAPQDVISHKFFTCNLHNNTGENTGKSFDVKYGLFMTKGFTLIATGLPAGFTWDNLR